MTEDKRVGIGLDTAVGGGGGGAGLADGWTVV